METYFEVEGDMILTEKEAKTKWCPEVRMIDEREEFKNQNSSNRTFSVLEELDPNPSFSCCIASDCMMWRYKEYEYVKVENVAPSDKKTLEGYCGLAGKP